MPSLKVPQDMWDKAERTAVDATLLRRTPVTISEVLRFTIQNSIDESLKDFISREKLKQTEKR